MFAIGWGPKCVDPPPIWTEAESITANLADDYSVIDHRPLGWEPMNRDQAIEHTIRTIAKVRVSPEAQEGLAAFLEKRTPRWS